MVIDKIVRASEEEFSLPPGVEERGSYNLMPQPFREAEADEYYHHVAHYTPDFMEYRQVKDLPDLPFSSVKIFWFRRQGWAVRYPNKWHSRRPDEGEGYRLVWDEPIRYYKIGCDHLYKTIERLNRWTDVMECERCGTQMVIEE